MYSVLALIMSREVLRMGELLEESSKTQPSKALFLNMVLLFILVVLIVVFVLI